MDRLKLFDGDGDSSDEDSTKIEINHEFAKRYEYNKKREELQKYEALKKKGLVDSSDSDPEETSSEEESTNPTKKTVVKFLDALIKVKNQDPILREPDGKLFNSDDDEDEDEEGDANKNKGNKEKPMYLKDVISKQLIEAGPEFSDEEEESEDDGGVKNKIKSYSEEQEEKRQQIVKALEVGENDVDDDSGDFLRVKSSGKEEEDEDEDGFGEKVEVVFGEDEKLDEKEKFLKDYFLKTMWEDDGKSKLGGNVDIEVSDDDDEIEKQEEYERDYNFRFEENAGDRVMGHSRKVEGSVRKKDNARKSQRERKEERMAQAEFERKEELKRMKNLKKKEITERLEKIGVISGHEKGKKVFDKHDLEDDFDPEAHDRKMKEVFNEEYYGEEDQEFKSDGDEDGEELEKPDFDKEDELLGLEKGWDGVDKLENLVDEDVEDEQTEGKRKRKRKVSDVQKAIMEELMDEYYKLDYEGTVGDLTTRFKYKPVKAKRFRLTTQDILMRDDKELNQYVPLKKLAPYREKEWEVPKNKVIQLKKSKLLKGNTSRPINEDREERHHKGKAKEEEVKAVESERPQLEESNGEKENISRKKKRKQKQAELKISQSRLMAYGKIPSKSKSKNQ